MSPQDDQLAVLPLTVPGGPPTDWQVIHRISKIPRGPWVGDLAPEGAFDDMPFIDALHANDL